MHRYILINKKLVGYLIFTFSRKSGHLMHFENCTFGMTEEQLKYLMEELEFCRYHSSFKEWANDRGHVIIPGQEDISFERFWTEYDYQRNKQGAERYWKSMNDDQRRYALHSIPAYQRYCQQNVSWYTKKYPDGYLGAEKLYMTEWDKMMYADKQKKAIKK